MNGDGGVNLDGAMRRCYWFGAVLLLVVLLVTSLLPGLLALIVLTAAGWFGYKVSGNEWEIPNLSPWLRGDG